MGMNRIRRFAVLSISAALCLALGNANSVRAQAPAGQDAAGKQQPYTIPEYNAEQACANDKNPTSQVKCLDDFVSKYPNSNLLIYVYPMYYQAYYQLKNWPKVIENADKVVSLGEKVGANDRYNALYVRAFAYNSLSPADQTAQAKTAITGASAALELQPDLKKLIVNYQQAACDNLVDAELNELLQLAGSSAERPASYKVVSATDLDAARKDMTIASVITDLKAGGDKAKTTWLASCGLEFPDVPGKLLEITPAATPNDPIVLHVAFVTSDAEFQAATTPNMVVNVVGQPDAARLEKDNPVRFTATLSSFDPDPNFMLHWDKAKVNAEDIPKEKTPTKKPAPRRPAAKKPGV